MCTPVAPPLGPADLAHLHFRSTELSSSKRQKEKLYSDALWGATSGWCAACGSRLSSVGVIYDIVHAAPRDGRAMGELAFKPAAIRERRASIADPRITRAATGPAARIATDWPCRECPGISTEVLRCRFEGLKDSQFSSRVRK